MKTQIIYKENHQKYIDEKEKEQTTYKTYMKYLNEQLHIQNKLKELLKNYDCIISVIPDDDRSWCGYKCELYYKKHNFEISKDYKGKLNIYFKELNKYHSAIVYNTKRKEFERDNKPLNYTFDKLNTNNLIKALEYKISLLKLYKDLYNEDLENNLKLFNEYKEKLKFIADELNTDFKLYETEQETRYYTYTPLKHLEISFNKYDNKTHYDYDINKFIEIINIIKAKRNSKTTNNNTQSV